MPLSIGIALFISHYAPRRLAQVLGYIVDLLAAVPSIIFGLLGLAVLLGTFGLPRSASIVGGLTLALMTMPVIVIAGRNAIKGVPPSVRDAALANRLPPTLVLLLIFVIQNNVTATFQYFNAQFDLPLGVAMLLGRFVPIVFVLALAGSLAAQDKVPTTSGTLPTHRPMFIGLLTAVTVLVTALTFFPVLALGPLAEGLM